MVAKEKANSQAGRVGTKGGAEAALCMQVIALAEVNMGWAGGEKEERFA